MEPSSDGVISGQDGQHSVGDLNGTKPITNRESRMVMLRGEREDEIQIDNVIGIFREVNTVPREFRIVRRVGTYHGPELLLHALEIDGDSKFLITAPGPDAFLYLWSAETDSDGFRVGWSKIAEIQASFSDGLPKYTLCNVCGEPIKSLEHERLAAIDQCNKLSD